MAIQNINGARIGKYYTLNGVFASAVWSPADGITYFAGARASLSTISVGGRSRVYVPQGGTITKSYLFVANDGTLGSAETSTIAILKNNVTATTVSAAVTTNSTGILFSNTGLTISVATGDYIEWRWVAPTWATNPTSLRIWCTALIEV
jgi:hypothetical protein